MFLTSFLILATFDNFRINFEENLLFFIQKVSLIFDLGGSSFLYTGFL